MLPRTLLLFLIFLILTITACAEKSSDPSPSKEVSKLKLDETGCQNKNINRVALFGDLHVHTRYSFDAAANSTGATPEDAHRYAKGQEIPFFPLDEDGVAVGRAKIDRPLDFLAVTDHGEFLGERALCRNENSPRYDIPFCETTGQTGLGV